MRALVYHGKRDVRVDTVPDPTIEEPTDAIVRITSSGLCGSDLHLYEVLGAFLEEGDILGHEPMGIVEAVGQRGDAHRVRAIASSSRSTSRAATASCARTSCTRSARRRRCATQDKGASLFGYTKLYGAGARRPGGAAARAAGAVRPDQGAGGPGRRPVRLPLGRAADGLAGRGVRRHPRRRQRWSCSGWARSARCARRIALHRGAGRVIGVDLVPERLAMAARHGVEPLDLDERRRPRGSAARDDRRSRPRLGHRRGRHGGARRAVRQARADHGRVPARPHRRAADREGRHRPHERAARGHRHRPARRHGVARRASTAG